MWSSSLILWWSCLVFLFFVASDLWTGLTHFWRRDVVPSDHQKPWSTTYPCSPTFSGEQKELARVLQLWSHCCQTTVIGSLIFGLVGRDSGINCSVVQFTRCSLSVVSHHIWSVAILARYIGSSSQNKKLPSHPPCYLKWRGGHLVWSSSLILWWSCLVFLFFVASDLWTGLTHFWRRDVVPSDHQKPWSTTYPCSPTFSGEQKELARVLQLWSHCCQTTVIDIYIYLHCRIISQKCLKIVILFLFPCLFPKKKWRDVWFSCDFPLPTMWRPWEVGWSQGDVSFVDVYNRVSAEVFKWHGHKQCDAIPFILFVSTWFVLQHIHFWVPQAFKGFERITLQSKLVLQIQKFLIYIYIYIPWKSKTKQRTVFGMIHVKDSLVPRGKVWSLDFLGYIYICRSLIYIYIVPCSSTFQEWLPGWLASYSPSGPDLWTHGVSVVENGGTIHPCQLEQSGCWTKNRGKTPQIIHFNREIDVSKNNGTPKSSILIGFSINFTIHFGGFCFPIFGLTPKWFHQWKR